VPSTGLSAEKKAQFLLGRGVEGDRARSRKGRWKVPKQPSHGLTRGRRARLGGSGRGSSALKCLSREGGWEEGESRLRSESREVLEKGAERGQALRGLEESRRRTRQERVVEDSAGRNGENLARPREKEADEEREARQRPSKSLPAVRSGGIAGSSRKSSKRTGETSGPLKN